MNNLRNSVQLIGHLGMNPEVKELEKGKKMAKFSIATTESYRNSDGKQVKETQWHNIVAWGGAATLAERYLTKGREVVIQGRLTHRSYEDKNGTTKYFTEVVVNEIVLLGNGKNE